MIGLQGANIMFIVAKHHIYGGLATLHFNFVTFVTFVTRHIKDLSVLQLCNFATLQLCNIATFSFIYYSQKN